MFEKELKMLENKRVALRTRKNNREKVFIGKVILSNACGHTNVLLKDNGQEKYIKYNELKNFDLLRIYEE